MGSGFWYSIIIFSRHKHWGDYSVLTFPNLHSYKLQNIARPEWIALTLFGQKLNGGLHLWISGCRGTSTNIPLVTYSFRNNFSPDWMMEMWIVGVTSFLFHRIVHGGSLLVHYFFDSDQLNHSECSGDERYFDIDESNWRWHQ